MYSAHLFMELGLCSQYSD